MLPASGPSLYTGYMWSAGREQFAFLVHKSLDQEKKPNSDLVWTMRSWTSSFTPWFGKNLGALGTRVNLFWIWEGHRYLFMNKREAYGTSVQKIFISCLFQLPRRKQVFLPHWFWIHSYAFLWLVRCVASRDLKCILIDGLGFLNSCLLSWNNMLSRATRRMKGTRNRPGSNPH